MKNSIYQISTVLLILLFIIHLILNKSGKQLLEVIKLYKIPLILLGLFVISMTVSSLLGVSPKGVLSDIGKYILRYIIIFIALLYFYQKLLFNRQTLLAFIFIALSIHALDGLYQYITGFDFMRGYEADGGSRHMLRGAIHQHNPFGLFMSLGAIFSLYLLLEPKQYISFKYEKTLYFFALLLFIFTLFHSQSRSSWVMFGLFSLSYFILYLKTYGINKKFLIILFLLILSILTIFLLDEQLLHRLQLLLEGNSAGRTSKIWPFTIEKIKESPIFGYGINTYTQMKGHCCFGVHNTFLEILLYTGIVGFTIFITLLWQAFKESFSKDSIVYGILLFSYMILLQFDGNLTTSKIHLNIFILILFFIYSFRLDKKRSASE
jgi:O-antigen ligase